MLAGLLTPSAADVPGQPGPGLQRRLELRPVPHAHVAQHGPGAHGHPAQQPRHCPWQPARLHDRRLVLQPEAAAHRQAGGDPSDPSSSSRGGEMLGLNTTSVIVTEKQ